MIRQSRKPAAHAAPTDADARQFAVRKPCFANTVERMDDLFSLIQWPAFATSLGAAWLVASTQKGRRNLGFWIFLASNILWVIWGLHTNAWALIALQVCLAVLNVRGLVKTDQG